MEQVHLTTDGGVILRQKRIETDPLVVLGFQVEPDFSYRLRSFFQMLANYPVLLRLNPFARSLLEQYKAAPETGCVCPEIDHLELGKVIEMRGFPGEPGIETYHTFKGVQDEKVLDIRSHWIDNLLDMPLCLGRLKHVVFGDRIQEFSFETNYTLFEVIDGILWALSFHNMPVACRLSLP